MQKILNFIKKNKQFSFFFLLVILLIFVAVFAPVIAPQDPYVSDLKNALQAPNSEHWFGTDKLEAENVLLEKVKDAYILRPPYLYGPMNNVYREAFVFDCALADRKFYLPKDGSMKLQFFHVKDLCGLMEVIIKN